MSNRSKYLAMILRHKPESANLTLDKEGWCAVSSLIKNAQFTLAELEEIVSTDDKKRYSFNENKTKIRANQGHSTDVKLTFKKAVPPPKLYHGADDKALDLIFKHGLKPMARHHVHLSHDLETAIKVGQRRKSFTILEIDAAQALADKVDFYISENGVWLADSISPKYISKLA